VTLTLDPSHAPPEALERNERAERVRVAIRALPARQRVALVLKHYEGMSYAEIAETMQTSRRAVDSMLARARQALKEMLADLL
jgi:RNA polymerase sigma-70 factor (ECF subfamily)